jgi:hypothetical protein
VGCGGVRTPSRQLSLVAIETNDCERKVSREATKRELQFSRVVITYLLGDA